MLEQLIDLTNTEDFNNNWKFFVTKAERLNKCDDMILVLEAHNYDGNEPRLTEKKKWIIRCEGYEDHKLNPGFLYPHYRMKVVKDHPVLLNYAPCKFFSVSGKPSNASRLMSKLFTVNTQISGNWMNFLDYFGELPWYLKRYTETKLVLPESLLDIYFKVFDKYGVKYRLDNYESHRREDLSALKFSCSENVDIYLYGQPYVVAREFREV